MVLSHAPNPKDAVNQSINAVAHHSMMQGSGEDSR